MPLTAPRLLIENVLYLRGITGSSWWDNIYNPCVGFENWTNEKSCEILTEY